MGMCVCMCAWGCVCVCVHGDVGVYVCMTAERMRWVREVVGQGGVRAGVFGL